MPMKKTIILAITALICVLTANAEDKTAVAVWKASNNFQAYNISEKVVIKHADDKLVMNVGGKVLGTYDIYDGLKITFKEKAEKGDVNCDKSVSMADANVVVNDFLSGEAANINVTAADYNEDGDISMADANAIVNEFIGQ